MLPTNAQTRASPAPQAKEKKKNEAVTEAATSERAHLKGTTEHDVAALKTLDDDDDDND